MSSLKGMDEVLAKLALLDGSMRGAAMTQAMAAAATQAEGKVKERAREEFYTGSRPYTRTGNLLNSIQSTAKDQQGVVYVGAEYGVYLEMGTSRGIAPRAYVRRGVEQNLGQIAQAAVTTLKGKLGT